MLRFLKNINGPLTLEDFEKIKQIVQEERIACVVYSNRFGFEFGVALYGAPLTIGAPPEPIVSLDWRHAQPHIPQRSFAAYWAFYEPLFKTALNDELLALYGLPPTGRMSDYDY